MLAYMYLLPVTIFFLMHGRGYYPAPSYVILIAAGMMTFNNWIKTLKPKPELIYLSLSWLAILAGVIIGALTMLPIAPINSALWKFSSGVHDNFSEQLGWRELNQHVANVYHTLPADEKSRTEILAGNYGEAGALALYGGEFNLPQVISPANSFWLQGAPAAYIDELIVVGYDRGC